MVGKIIGGVLLALLCLLGALLLALVLISLIPVRIRLTYDQGDAALGLRFGPLRYPLFPRPEKKEKPDQKEKKKKEKPPRKETPKKPRAKINREQIFYALEKLPPILGRALRRTGRSIRVEPLKVYLLVAGEDPADTAALYGRLEAALGAGLPILRRTVRIRGEDVRLYLDFTQSRMDCIADVGISLRPWSLLTIGARALGSLLKWYLGFRKLASPPPEPEERNGGDKTSEAA